MTFYVYAEDFVAGVVGPFRTAAEALSHIEFCKRRGDADPGRVITQEELDKTGEVFMMTPEQDLAWKFPNEATR